MRLSAIVVCDEEEEMYLRWFEGGHAVKTAIGAEYCVSLSIDTGWRVRQERTLESVRQE